MTRTTRTRSDYLGMAMAERAGIADLVASLTPEQWEARTLCEGWRARDVVAHMFSYEALSTLGLIGLFVKGPFTRGGVNAVALADYADRTPSSSLIWPGTPAAPGAHRGGSAGGSR